MINQLNLKPEREELQPGIVRSGERPSPDIALRALQHAVPAFPPADLMVQPAVRARRRIWPALLAGALFLAVCAAAAAYFMNRGRPDAVLLQAAEREGILLIEWEGDSAPAARAGSGTLEITENGQTRKYELSKAELRKGAFSAIRQGEDVTAKLTLNGPAGGVHQEITHYLGNPLPSKADPHIAEIEELKTQNQSLRAELEKERARANELQSWADVLESSLKRRAAR